MSRRVWMITGASSGLGRAIAEAALAAGDIVAATARRPESLSDLQACAPDRLSIVELDVTEDDRLAPAVDEVVVRHGRLDVLVNNAGRGLVGAAEETGDRELRDLMDLHFFAAVALTRAALPHMRKARTGAIVQISSQAGRLSFPGLGAYSASKFALEGWSEALAAEVESLGIRVLIVEPGPFRTAFYDQERLSFSPSNPAYAEQIEPIRTGLSSTNARPAGDPEKAAAAIIAALGSANPPLRLVLGNEAVDRIGAAISSAREELVSWEAVSRGADHGA